MIRWKQATFDDWHGRKPNYEEVERGDWQEVSGTDEAWQADIQRLHAISREFMGWVQSLSEEDLARPVAGDDMALGIRLMRMATHDTYHAGQIRYVRALQGT